MQVNKSCVINDMMELLEREDVSVKVRGNKIIFLGDKKPDYPPKNAAKQVWDIDSYSMLRLLSVNGCPRSLAGMILNRSKENLYSKV